MRGLLSGSVLVISNLFEPIHNFSVELLLNGDMGHGRCESGAMPVLFAGGKPDHISGTDFFDRSAFALSPAVAGSDDQGLTERVGVPCGPRARLEGDACTLNKRWIWCLEERIDPYRAGEPIGRSFGGRLRTVAFDLHGQMICQAYAGRSIRTVRIGPKRHWLSHSMLMRVGTAIDFKAA